jgi:hypothetical protein
MAHLIYIDDSRDEKLCLFSALAVPADNWLEAFRALKEHRHRLKKTDGIYVYKELHAWKFVSGRGKVADRDVSKARRCELFKETLQVATGLEGTRLFNAVFPAKQDEKAFEWLVNRINRTMQVWDSHAFLICDRGKDIVYTRLTRRMSVHNPIPSQLGHWEETGGPTKNIPTDRVVEDPFFRDSRQSYFIQLVDFCAYALLRRENPVPSRSAYGLDDAFNLLSPILFLPANRRDPEGIIRPY